MSTGRPTLLTDELQERILQYAKAGVPQVVIADAVRIPKGTLSKWLKFGDPEWSPTEGQIEGSDYPKDREPYRLFRESFRDAQARPVVICEATWLRAAQGTRADPGDPKKGIPPTPAVPGDPKAAERWLRLHRPDLYREHVDVEIGGPMAKAVEGWAASIRAMIEDAAASEE